MGLEVNIKGSEGQPEGFEGRQRRMKPAIRKGVTEEQTGISPFLQVFVPYRGRCPKKGESIFSEPLVSDSLALHKKGAQVGDKILKNRESSKFQNQEYVLQEGIYLYANHGCLKREVQGSVSQASLGTKLGAKGLP